MTWKHGTQQGYRYCGGGNRLACDDCRRANREAAALRRRAAAYGITGPHDRISSLRTQQALHWLAGMGHNTIAIQQLTGLPNTIVSRLLRDRQDGVYRETQERVLAGLHWALRNPTWSRPSKDVPSDRAWQQVRSLEALGWPLATLMTEIGYKHPVQQPPWARPMMNRRTAERVQQLYDRLSGTRGPSARAAAHAARLGWHVPLAYDDDGHLIPEAIPNDLTRAAERREDRQARTDQVAALTAKGLSTAEIAEALGITDRTVTRARSRRSA